MHCSAKALKLLTDQLRDINITDVLTGNPNTIQLGFVARWTFFLTSLSHPLGYSGAFLWSRTWLSSLWFCSCSWWTTKRSHHMCRGFHIWDFIQSNQAGSYGCAFIQSTLTIVQNYTLRAHYSYQPAPAIRDILPLNSLEDQIPNGQTSANTDVLPGADDSPRGCSVLERILRSEQGHMLRH